MSSVDQVNRTAIFSFGILVLLLAGCSGNVVKVDLPQNMVPVNDAVKKLHFKIPPGWQQGAADPVIEKATKKTRRWGDPVGFRKSDKGTFTVWCNQWDKDRSLFLFMADAVDAYAPQHDLFTCFEVDSPGAGFLSTPKVCTAPASHVVKGEKKSFLIITAIKDTPATAALKECEYIVLGRSTSGEFDEEIKADIMAVAATLDNSGENK
jgi:hypothetical protein